MNFGLGSQFKNLGPISSLGDPRVTPIPDSNTSTSLCVHILVWIFCHFTSAVLCFLTSNDYCLIDSRTPSLNKNLFHSSIFLVNKLNSEVVWSSRWAIINIHIPVIYYVKCFRFQGTGTMYAGLSQPWMHKGVLSWRFWEIWSKGNEEPSCIRIKEWVKLGVRDGAVMRNGLIKIVNWLWESSWSIMWTSEGDRTLGSNA